MSTTKGIVAEIEVVRGYCCRACHHVAVDEDFAYGREREQGEHPNERYCPRCGISIDVHGCSRVWLNIPPTPPAPVAPEPSPEPQPTALEIARERLGRTQDPRNITMLDTQQTDALVAIASALIALAERGALPEMSPAELRRARLTPTFTPLGGESSAARPEPAGRTES